MEQLLLLAAVWRVAVRTGDFSRDGRRHEGSRMATKAAVFHLGCTCKFVGSVASGAVGGLQFRPFQGQARVLADLVVLQLCCMASAAEGGDSLACRQAVRSNAPRRQLVPHTRAMTRIASNALCIMRMRLEVVDHSGVALGAGRIRGGRGSLCGRARKRRHQPGQKQPLAGGGDNRGSRHSPVS